MPTELWTKLAADAPILLILLLVLWRGDNKFDKLIERLDKLTLTMKGLTSKVEMIGRLQDARFDLHEERSTKHPTNGAAPNGASPRAPSWPDVKEDEE